MINHKCIITLLFCFQITAIASSSNEAIDVELFNGTKYPSSKIVSDDGDKIIIANKDGVFTLRKDDLTEQQKQSLGWTAAAREKYYDAAYKKYTDQKNEESKAKLEKALISLTIVARVQVFQVTEDGILVTEGIGYGGPVKERKIAAVYKYEEKIQRETLPGLDGPTVYTKHITIPVMVSPERVEKYRDKYRFPDLFFIEMPTDGMVDGQFWSGSIWEDGAYVYASVMGARKTVKRYTVNPPKRILDLEDRIKNIDD